MIESGENIEKLVDSKCDITPNSNLSVHSGKSGSKGSKDKQFHPNKDSRCKNGAEELNRPIIDLFSILNPRLQHIYNIEDEDMEKSFKDQAMQMEKDDYRYEVMIAFWFAIHLGNLKAAQKLYDMDPIIAKIMQHFRSDDAIRIIETMNMTDEKKKGRFQMSQTSNDMSMSMAAEDKSKEVVEEEVIEQNKEEGDNQEEEQVFKDNENDDYLQIGGMGFKKLKTEQPIEKMANELAQKNQYNLVLKAFEIKADQKQEEDEEQDSDREPNYNFGCFVDRELYDDDKYNELVMQDLVDVRTLIQDYAIGIPFNTNILKIALNHREEMIAQTLVYSYQVSIQEEMIISAIKKNLLDFLYCVYAYNKNFEYRPNIPDDDQKSDSSSDERDKFGLNSRDGEQQKEEDMRTTHSNYLVFTYDYLIEKILKYVDENAEQRIRLVAAWKLQSTENFLMSLLKNNQDVIAADFGLFYSSMANIELLNYALENENGYFLKHSFRKQIFQSSYLNNGKMIKHLLDILEEGNKTDIILNVLTFSKFSLWGQDLCFRFIQIASDILEKDIEPNKMFKCYNPIQTICLICEFLQMIGQSIAVLNQTGTNLSMGLQSFGEKIIEQMNDQQVQELFKDVDYLDRTVLHLITKYKFQPLCSDPKLKVYLDELWNGKDTYSCDGQDNDFSLLSFLYDAPIKKLPGKSLQIETLTYNGYTWAYDQKRFPLQYKYRISCIAKIFQKEMISTALVGMIMMSINYQYNYLFSYNQQFQIYDNNIKNLQKVENDKDFWKKFYDGDGGSPYKLAGLTNYNDTNCRWIVNNTWNETYPQALEWCLDFWENKTKDGQEMTYPYTYIKNPDEQLTFLTKKELENQKMKIQQNIEAYSNYNRFGIIVSMLMIFYVIKKQLFNVFATIKLPFDKWNQADIMAASINIICFLVSVSITPEIVFGDKGRNDQRINYNYLQTCSLAVTYYRIFSMLYVVPKISQLQVTIVIMLGSASTFLFIYVMYSIIMVGLVQTIFQEKSIQFSNFIFSFRTLFDAMMGMYDWDCITPDLKYAYTYFLYVHIFFSNVFLLNYLVAILGSVYEAMMDVGEFAYSCNRYMFIERYHIAFQDEWGYSELIVHPPPYNILLVTILPSVMNKHLMQSSARVFSKFNFWAENVLIYIPQHFAKELILVPIIYLKVLFSVVKLADFKQLPLYIIGWSTGGLLFLIGAAFYDMYHFIKILFDPQEERELEIIKNIEDARQDRIVIYNEIITTIKLIILIFLQKQKKQCRTGQRVIKIDKDTEDIEIEKALKLQDCETDDRPKEGYMLKKETIMEAWARYRPVQSGDTGGEVKKKAVYLSDIPNVFSQDFIHKMMSEIKLKQYEFRSSDIEVRRKKTFKENFTQHYKQKVEAHNEKKKNHTHAHPHHHVHHEKLLESCPEAETDYIDKFLSQFVLDVNATPAKGDILDMKLALQALPSKIDRLNEFQCQLFNFQQIDSAIIDFQNTETDKLFKFFDDRNQQRLKKLQNKASITKDQTHFLKEMGSTVLSILKKIVSVGEKNGLTKKGHDLKELYLKIQKIQKDPANPTNKGLIKEIQQVLRNRQDDDDNDDDDRSQFAGASQASKLTSQAKKKDETDGVQIQDLIEEYENELIALNNKDVMKVRTRRHNEMLKEQALNKNKRK